jgi:hypothetical protein
MSRTLHLHISINYKGKPTTNSNRTLHLHISINYKGKPTTNSNTNTTVSATDTVHTPDSTHRLSDNVMCCVSV